MLLLLFAGAKVQPQNPTRETILMPAKASGPYYTRKRYRELLEAQEAERRAEMAIATAASQKQLDAAVAKAESARRKVIEALRKQADDYAQQARGASLQRPTQGIVDALRHSAMAGQAKASHDKLMADDEEEAISLLLLH